MDIVKKNIKRIRLVLSSRMEKLCDQKNQMNPEGYFSVYVGSKKDRFVIKMEFLNHPLFKKLLEDAAMEYGYSCEGPLKLPCEVDLFMQILAEIVADNDDDNEDRGEDGYRISNGCKFVKGYGFLSVHSPARPGLVGGEMAKGYGSFSVLNTSKFCKME